MTEVTDDRLAALRAALPSPQRALYDLAARLVIGSSRRERETDHPGIGAAASAHRPPPALIAGSDTGIPAEPLHGAGLPRRAAPLDCSRAAPPRGMPRLTLALLRLIDSPQHSVAAIAGAAFTARAGIRRVALVAPP